MNEKLIGYKINLDKEIIYLKYVAEQLKLLNEELKGND